jgi:pyruvate/2-oxoglutarate dehydrogenase complex dihydrolipoamide dehydrogenase (E3) component
LKHNHDGYFYVKLSAWQEWLRSPAAGVTFVGPGVEELIHSATIAVAGQVPLARLWHAVPCFPSISEVWLRLLEACRG